MECTPNLWRVMNGFFQQRSRAFHCSRRRGNYRRARVSAAGKTGFKRSEPGRRPAPAAAAPYLWRYECCRVGGRLISPAWVQRQKATVCSVVLTRESELSPPPVEALSSPYEEFRGARGPNTRRCLSVKAASAPQKQALALIIEPRLRDHLCVVEWVGVVKKKDEIVTRKRRRRENKLHP